MPRKPREGLRDDLIAEAEKIIRKEGLSALTARRLAAGVNCAVGSIYNVFEDLDDLIVEVHGRTLERLAPAIAAGITGDGGIEDRLIGLARGYLMFTTEERHLWLALFEHSLPEGRTVPPWYRQKLNVLFDMVEEVISPLFADPGSDDHKRAARILWSSLHGICSLGLTDKLDLISNEDIDVMVEDMIHTYIAGMAANK